MDEIDFVIADYGRILRAERISRCAVRSHAIYLLDKLALGQSVCTGNAGFGHGINGSDIVWTLTGRRSGSTSLS